MTTSPLKTDNGSGLTDWHALVDLWYAPGSLARDVLLTHSEAVGNLALDIKRRLDLNLTDDEIVRGAMVHDIGMIRTHAPAIGCGGELPYICHGTAGADMLRTAGAPEWMARIAERHTGTGITPEDIRTQDLPLPTDRILVPETLLEKLICYADKFFSKRIGQLKEIKSVDRVRAEMTRHGSASADRFESLHRMFGLFG